jgi:hypothetical protein
VEDSRGGSLNGYHPFCFQPNELHVLGDCECQQYTRPTPGQVSVCEGLAVHEDSVEQLHIWPSPRDPIQRTPRHPKYSDHELIPFFDYMAQGYCYKQSADKCLYPQDWVRNTFYSDDETFGYMLDLSMEAGAKIRRGLMAPPPDRYDGLWDKYIGKSLTI